MSISASNYKTERLYTDTILIPNMAPVQFGLLQAALESEGMHCVMLGSESRRAAELGLKYVHNDTCYPAVLIIGQFLEALESGQYDPAHTSLLITQTGGGCRASNYYRLLKKALARAGYENIPVLSANFSGLEKDSSLPVSLRLLKKAAAAVWYGDEIFALRNQVKPYEIHEGETESLAEGWLKQCAAWIRKGKNISPFQMKRNFRKIAKDFAEIATEKTGKIKVGVVGEIFVKFSPLGNNELVKFLEEEGCEVNMPGLMGFVEYCIANYGIDIQLYGGARYIEKGAKLMLRMFDNIGKSMSRALRKSGFYAPCSFFELMKKPEGIIHLGAKMGEGWLLTAEMAELIEGGYANIVCAQPFGCLPNHIAGKGVINRLRQKYPEANITPVDYDPGASRVNQENRIRLMLAVANENLK